MIKGKIQFFDGVTPDQIGQTFYKAFGDAYAGAAGVTEAGDEFYGFFPWNSVKEGEKSVCFRFELGFFPEPQVSLQWAHAVLSQIGDLEYLGQA
jgi:hypothetical protein